MCRAGRVVTHDLPTRAQQIELKSCELCEPATPAINDNYIIALSATYGLRMARHNLWQCWPFHKCNYSHVAIAHFM